MLIMSAIESRHSKGVSQMMVWLTEAAKDFTTAVVILAYAVAIVGCVIGWCWAVMGLAQSIGKAIIRR